MTRAAAAGRPGQGRALLRPLGAGGAALICAAYVEAVDPNAAGHYPTCPFLAVTGWYCPGCGALRAAHALGHGDLMTALARNPLAVVAIGCLSIAWVVWLQRSLTGRPQHWVFPRWALYGVLAVVVAFGVLRNLPGWTWLSPA